MEYIYIYIHIYLISELFIVYAEIENIGGEMNTLGKTFNFKFKIPSEFLFYAFHPMIWFLQTLIL